MPSKISGHVLDNNRRPVGKVKVSLKGKVVAESGKDGSFSVNLAKAESRVAITFAAEGYVSNTRVYDSRAGEGNTIVIWPIAYRVKFDPSRELDIELGSSRIQVPANALTGSGGKRLAVLLDSNSLCSISLARFNVLPLPVISRPSYPMARFSA